MIEVVGDPQQGSDPAIAKQSSTEDGEVPKMDLERTLPRQISTGNQRGTQNLTGEQTVSDPVTNNQVVATSGINQNTIYSDPTTKTPQIILGRQSNGVYGMKVAPAGVNVLNAPDDQLIFNSSQNIFKIVDSGIRSGFTTDASPDLSITVNHGMNDVPGIIAFAQPPSNSLWSPLTVFPTFSGGYVPIPLYIYSQTTIAGSDASIVVFSITYEVNSTNLILRAHQGVTGLPNSTFPVSFRYYILQETAKTT